MSEWELEDIPPTNGKFTWSNKRLGPGHIAARLDRFLIQSSFLTLGLRASSKVLPHYTSDHKPIALSLRPSAALGPIPFKFTPLWQEQGDFLNLVHHSWKDPVTGSPFYVWEEKLRRLKTNLKSWAKNLVSPWRKGNMHRKPWNSTSRLWKRLISPRPFSVRKLKFKVSFIKVAEKKRPTGE
jgi:hypothetical protein